ncbi:exopolygalacturonase-like [Prosopis cineraria]|uniref:exopolygalacturonase-like n=1 Tax=Prosopis cineraria TaxID=364024 RepID=UPI0024109EA5|nr:exopolygalacturonase-like [Prosopis cineraria]XP_054805520.1 exopolygalacturonase-like [Prosopis cineraria]
MERVALSISIAVVAYAATSRIGMAMAPVPEPVDESPAQNSRAVRYFDVTKYGADSDGKTESSSAFLAAWEDACSAAGNSVLLIPEGTFLVGPVSFSGPCRNNESPKIEIGGTLKAPSSFNSFQSSDWIVLRGLNGINLTGINSMAVLDGQGAESWSKNACHKHKHCFNLPSSLRFMNVSHGTVSSISLLNSKFFHVVIYKCDNMNVSNINIKAPADSPNTDGIHISLSSTISITSSIIGVGDDCVSIGPGTTNLSVSFVHCGPGHGISVGSLGKYPDEMDVDGVHVSNCTINGTQNGVRVKTWPGAPHGQASNLVFEDIAMINVSNPIIVDQEYCPSRTCKTMKPSGVKLRDMKFKNISGTYSTKFAVTLLCSSDVPCENVQMVGINLNSTVLQDFETYSFVTRGGIDGLKFLNS